MKRSRTIVFLLALGLAAPAVRAQETYSFLAFFGGGTAGAFDPGGSSDFGSDAWQAGFGTYADSRTLFVVRAGRLSVADGLAGEAWLDTDLEYANLAGEYRFRQAAYDFGIFLGLGAYRLEGEVSAGREEQTELGAVLGFTGDFDLTQRVSLLAEIDLHYVLFEETRLYGAALVGVAVHF